MSSKPPAGPFVYVSLSGLTDRSYEQKPEKLWIVLKPFKIMDSLKTHTFKKATRRTLAVLPKNPSFMEFASWESK